MRSFVKIKSSRNSEFSLSISDIGKSYIITKFFDRKFVFLPLFAKIKFSRNFTDLEEILLHERSCFIESIKQVEEKRQNARLGEHSIAFSQRI